MHLLLTNDDGIDAPGIATFHDALQRYLKARRWQAKITVVAPDQVRSECGHSVTTRQTLTVTQTQPDWYAVNGTPVDCVRIALHCICDQVDLVFSGINAGANVGLDLLMSGTFAAAREAAISGRPAIAVSHYRHPSIAKTWDHCSGWLDPILEQFWEEASQNRPDDSCLWNVNLPAIAPDGDGIPEVAYCPVDTSPLPRQGSLTDDQPTTVKMQSDFHGRPRTPGSDIDQCFAGKVSISRLNPFSLS